jgi:alpha-L-fucosidase
MNDTWGYKSYDENWKSSEELIRTLVDVASKGGNFLLNVGPMPEGLIPRESVRRLEDIGKWMKVNSESIYGTTASPIGRPEWGRCTAKGNQLYLHVFDWPANGKLEVPLAQGEVRKAYLLADKRGGGVSALRVGDKLTVLLPEQAPDRVDSVVVLTMSESK